MAVFTYDRIARFEYAGLLCIIHHPQGDAVLHAPSCVEVLAFGH